MQINRLDEGFESQGISDILSKTQDVSDEDDLYQQDVEDIVSILDKAKEKATTPKDNQNFIRSSSNIVSEKRRNVWRNIKVRWSTLFCEACVNWVHVFALGDKDK